MYIYIAWLAFALFKGVFAFSRARQRRAETHTRFYHRNIIYIYVCIIISVFWAATAMAAHVVALLFNRELLLEFIVAGLLIFQIPRGTPAERIQQ